MRLLVTYMEQRVAPAGQPLLAPVAGLALRQERMSVPDYLALYRTIGTPLGWDSRLNMTREDLALFLSAASTETFVLREEGRPIGLCEFDAVAAPDVELTHFGLVPAAYGRRLGPFLLDTALRAVWARTTQRVWLHTDTNDHPKAQATYARAGFETYRQQMEDFDD